MAFPDTKTHSHNLQGHDFVFFFSSFSIYHKQPYSSLSSAPISLLLPKLWCLTSHGCLISLHFQDPLLDGIHLASWTRARASGIGGLNIQSEGRLFQWCICATRWAGWLHVMGVQRKVHTRNWQSDSITILFHPMFARQCPPLPLKLLQ